MKGLYFVVSNENINVRIAECGAEGCTRGGGEGDAESRWSIVLSMRQGEVEGRMVFPVISKGNRGSDRQPLTLFSTDT